MITEKTFLSFYKLHYQEVCRYLSFFTQESLIIEDVVQDVFVHLWEDRENVEIIYVKTYLMKSARNRMLNYLRDTNLRRDKLCDWAICEYESSQAQECVNVEEFSACVQDAIRQLPDRCRLIYRMSREKKLSYREIAAQLELSEKTVEAQMGIALKRIKETLHTYYEIKKKNNKYA